MLRRRRDRLTDYLDAWGDLEVSDIGVALGRRRIEYAVEAPEQGLTVEVRLRYREYYLRTGPRWDMVKYTYEYLDVAHGRRLAFHLHDIGRRKLVPHAHCEAAIDLPEDEGPHHLRATEYDLREAHERSMALYAAGLIPDCDSFLPLNVPRLT